MFISSVRNTLWSRSKRIPSVFGVQVAMLTAPWALLRLPTQISCPSSLLPSETQARGRQSSCCSCPGPMSQEQGGQCRTMGNPPRPWGAWGRDAQGWLYLFILRNQQPSASDAQHSCLLPASKLGHFHSPKTLHSQQHEGRCAGRMGLPVQHRDQLHQNSARKLRAKRGAKKKGCSSCNDLAGSSWGEGESFCSGLVPISKTSSMLSHSHSYEE